VAVHANESFAHRRVDLDGSRFENCTFEACQIVYSGGDHTRIVGCTFDPGCTWNMDGAAARTLTFLRGIYQSMGPAGERLVEESLGIRRPPAAAAFTDQPRASDGAAAPQQHAGESRRGKKSKRGRKNRRRDRK
jgi:hypothetical protein